MKHKRQTTPAGCQWHAAYALIEDEKLLEHVDDICPMRFRFRLVEKGYFPYQYFGNFYNLDTTPAEFWRRLVEDLSEEGSLLVLAQYAMTNTQWHMAALIVAHNAVWVSDSLNEDIQSFWLEDFIKSHYAQAIRVELLYPMNPEYWPPELVSQNPELLYNPRWADS